MTKKYYSEATTVRFASYRVRYPSLVARPLTLLSFGQVISRATGFIFQDANSTYLVSNWHVFSGRDIYTGKPRHSLCAIPDEVEVQFPAGLLSDKKSVTLQPVAFPLQTEGGESLWLMHPDGQNVDVAVLPITIPQSDLLALAPVNIVNSIHPISRFLVATDVFIVGFPDNFPVEMGLPIWKRGTVAGEPLLNGEYSRKFLVDAATRQGMSGSPVFYRRNEVTMMDDGVSVESLGETEFVPCGIYSGRISTSDEFAATIGIVWPLGFIEDIVAAGVRGAFVLA